MTEEMRRVPRPCIAASLLVLFLAYQTSAASTPNPDNVVTPSNSSDTTRNGSLSRAANDSSTAPATSTVSNSEGDEPRVAEVTTTEEDASASPVYANQTTGCAACCGDGDCWTAFRGTPGTCCGVIAGKPYCCPTVSSSFGAAAGDELVFSHSCSRSMWWMRFPKYIVLAKMFFSANSSIFS